MSIKVQIVAGKRTPFGKFGGTLRDFSTVELSSHIMKSVRTQIPIESKQIEEVNWGVCTQAEAKEVVAPIIARQSLLKAGFLPETVSMTLDQACCSGLAAIKHSYYSIQRGEINTSLAGGAEVMSQTPMMIRPLRWGSRIGDVVVRDPVSGIRYFDYNLVSIDASEVALEFGVTREMQDDWAYLSQQRWKQADEKGFFEEELSPVIIEKKSAGKIHFNRDEFPRPNTTREQLSELQTVFESKTITAGNAPGLNDGAAALILMSEMKQKELEIESLATIITTASVAVEPRMIATVPGLAIKKALSKVGLTVDDLDLIEINEAFAAVPLVSSLILADGDKQKALEIGKKLNVNGGAIAIGHPVGASGARIVLTLVNELRKRGGGVGAASICGGLAQGEAIIVKVE